MQLRKKLFSTFLLFTFKAYGILERDFSNFVALFIDSLVFVLFCKPHSIKFLLRIIFSPVYSSKTGLCVIK